MKSEVFLGMIYSTVHPIEKNVIICMPFFIEEKLSGYYNKDVSDY